MKDGNGRNATNGNKAMQRLYFSCFLGIGLFLASPSMAQQGAVSAMANVKEVLVQYTNFANPKIATLCGLERETIAADITKILQQGSVPYIPVAEAKPVMLGVARIELVPEIATVNADSLSCTSWVSLQAQSRSGLQIPPIPTPRNVTVTYWRGGSLVTSSQSAHARLVSETMTKLSNQFAQQYRLDQPPALPQLNETKP